MCVVCGSLEAFFTNPDNRMARFLGNSAAQDKLLKFIASGVFPVTYEIASGANASERTLQDIKTGETLVKETRDVLGVFNIFRGVIASTYKSGKTLIKIFHERNESEIVIKEPASKLVENIKKFEIRTLDDGNRSIPNRQSVGCFTIKYTRKAKYNDILYGGYEKCLKFGSVFFNMMGQITYIFGFGLARPAANIRKYLSIKYNETGNRIADFFPIIMLVNHLSALSSQILELAYQKNAYERATLEGLRVTKTYTSGCIEGVMGTLEKSLEVCNDGLTFSRVVVPVYVQISLVSLIATIGLVRVWRKTR